MTILPFQNKPKAHRATVLVDVSNNQYNNFKDSPLIF